MGIPIFRRGIDTFVFILIHIISWTTLDTEGINNLNTITVVDNFIFRDRWRKNASGIYSTFRGINMNIWNYKKKKRKLENMEETRLFL